MLCQRGMPPAICAPEVSRRQDVMARLVSWAGPYMALVALAAWLLPPTVSAASYTYTDAACASAAVAWANDRCAGRQWGLANARFPQAWGVSRGAGVTVAV